MTQLSEKQLIIEKVMKNIFYNPNSRKSFNLVIKNFQFPYAGVILIRL